MYEHASVWIVFALILLLLTLRVYRRSRRSLSERERPTLPASSAIAAPSPSERRIVRVRGRAHTRHAIVFAHGWGEFHRLLPVQLGYGYFRRIPHTLRTRGHAVHVLHVPPTASIELRAKRLARQIKQLDQRVNIIAHSMGGLDARLAIARYGLSEHVASLTTLGTPHHGTPLADIAVALGDFPKSRELLSKLGLNVDGVFDLSTARALEFNKQVLDAPNVLYANVVGTADPDGVHALLSQSHRYLLRIAGPNDGVVPAVSQRWGETLEEIDADHWAQIGWFARLDVHALYARIAQHLIERDL
jgi:triacylglycerol lipase